METLRNLFAFILLLGGLVTIHELGHFVACLWCGVKVKEFGIGLPPRLVKIGEWRGTTITLNWIPLGGFIKPEGEFDDARPLGLAAAPARSRLLIFAAGPLANFIAAYLVFTLAFTTGWPDRVRVAATLTDYPAEVAGLKPGDVIVSINSTELKYSDQLTQAIYANLDQPMTIVVEREQQHLTLIMTPRTPKAEGDRPAGLNTDNLNTNYLLKDAMWLAAKEMFRQTQETLSLPIRLWVTHELKPEEVRFSSVVGLKQVSDKVVENSVKWNEPYPILHFVAVVSTALGITNLLPLPALDGGRIAFVLLELLRGKAVSVKREKIVHAFGIVALLGLMVVLVVQDVMKPLF